MTSVVTEPIRCRAAVLHGRGQPFSVEEIEVDPPHEGEVMVKIAAAGLCHSDYLLVTGDLGYDGYPVVPGHEGAGVITAVGPGVTRVKVGDHVLLTFIPSCGDCHWCNRNLQLLCVRGRGSTGGWPLDRTARMRTSDGRELRQFMFISTFAEYTVCPADSCVVVPKELSLETVSVAGCAVPTGYGAAVNRGGVRPGDATAVLGVGGVGVNAVQGAKVAGASRIIAIDFDDDKLELARQFGATDVINSKGVDPVEAVLALTGGIGVNQAIVTIPSDKGLAPALEMVCRDGTVVLVGIAAGNTTTVEMPINSMILLSKRVLGSVYGNCNPRQDFPRILDLYQKGVLKLDELITSRYSLDQINEGYQDLHHGKNIRGIMVY